MKLWSVVRSRRVLSCVSLALLLSLAAGMALPTISRADDDKSLFSQLGRKKKAAAAPAATGHSQGSGIPATTETRVINDGSVTPFVTPDSPALIQAMADKYAKIVADGGWPVVPKGRIKKGSEGKQVAALNQRLHVEGYLQAAATEGEFKDVFTSATEDALKRFQVNHGLAPTGVIDGVTLAALNVPAAQRLATIQANIPRFAEYAKDLGPRYVVVNVPAQQIETVSDGKVYSLHNAIVGRESRPTPVVMTPLTIVRFNPYWNAPPSIIERDIIPRMQSRGASKVLADMNIKVFQGVGGPEVDPDKINWKTAKITDYHFRQEPGGENAMATAKVEFNSPFGIYLHDTPEPQLFKTSNRFYSSGCVRVDQVAILLNWILQGQDGLDQAKIADLAQTKERLDVEIANAPQLRVAYLTAWPAKDGVAAFRNDVYQLDGTGFVVGQPLPVGEKVDGQRFVLKPIPYLQDDIDTNDGSLLATLFRGGSKSNDVAGPGQNKKANDSLIRLGSTKTATAEKAAGKTAKSTGPATTKKHLFGGSKDELASASSTTTSTTTTKGAKKKLVQKKSTKPAATKATTAKAGTTAKTTKTAATKPATKTADKAKTAAADKKTATTAAAADKKPAATTAATDKKPAATTTAATKPATAAKPATTAKPATSCKPGADGKLPAGCPASKPAAAATPAKPAAAKTATADTKPAN